MPQEFMKVGLIHFMAYPQCMGGEGPIVETVSAIARDPFFDVIEVTHMKDAAVRQKVRGILDASRIEPCFGAQPITLGGKLDLNHPDADGSGKAIAAVMAGIDQAAELGCKGVAVLSGPVTEDRDDAKARLVDSLKQLCAYAASKGIRMALETFDQVPFGKNCLVGPTEEAAEVCAEVREEFPDFGLLLDLSHLPLLGETAEHAINTAGAYLTHVHIGNCAMDDPNHPAYGDNHPRFGAPGTRNDVAELADFLQVLADVGYLSATDRRIVSFEVKPMPGEDPESVIAGSKRTLLEAWRRVLVV
jgi:sugar phosphate isomerase/epimerase